MSQKFEAIVNSLVDSLQSANDKKTAPYSTDATVKRIDGNVAWVHIDGGVDETPVELTIDAKAGDTVKVQLSGGRAWLIGNGTAPPTDDTIANKADARAGDAQGKAVTAISKAEHAQDTAEDAATKATSYITKIDDHGIRIHPSATELDATVINGEGMEVFKGGTSVASYGDVARIGLEAGYHTRISDSGIELREGDNPMFSLRATGGVSSIVNSQIVLAVYKGTSGTSRSTTVILDPDINYTFSIYASPSRGAVYSFTSSSASTVSKTVSSDDGKYKMILSFVTQTAVVNGTTQIVHVKCTITETRTSTSYPYPAVGYRYASEIQESTIHSLGNNNVLWEGALLMGDYDTITLNESVSAQLSGIVLVWSAYENGAGKDWSWRYTYVPKEHVFNHGGTGVFNGLWTANTVEGISWKYVYINDTEIIGFSENDDAGTFAGIAFENSGFALRYVLGV